MESGSITNNIDVAQLVLYGFWIFFAGLIYYLRTEDKREGYPLVGGSGGGRMEGFPPMPGPKVFKLANGTSVIAPTGTADDRVLRAVPVLPWAGAPLQPTGNPMLSGVGASSYAEREDTPDLDLSGAPKILPLRAAPNFSLEARDPDPRGMEVVGADGKTAGTIKDVWVDRMEVTIRYLEVDTGRENSVLLPMPFARIDRRSRRVRVKSILADQFDDVPKLQSPTQVTLLEEDKISAYYGGGYLYAKPSRSEPLL
jgi:photosynthetic reaction center H subunit